MKVDDLLVQVRRRIESGRPIESELAGQTKPPRTASRRALAAAERELGVPLPPLLHQLYREIANGGFGPGYGLVGVPPGGATDDRGRNLVALYGEYRLRDPDDPLWSWPEGLLPVAHLGCAMYGCVNAAEPDGPVVWFEPNPHEIGQSWDSSFIPLRISLAGWLEAWLEGRDPIAELGVIDDDGV